MSDGRWLVKAAATYSLFLSPTALCRNRGAACFGGARSSRMSSTVDPLPAQDPATRPKRQYVPAVGPKLRKLLLVVFALTALLAANSCYLLTISTLERITGQPYQNWFSLSMVLAHIVLGVLLIVPFLVFGLTHMLTARTRKNRRAIRIGYALFAVSTLVLLTGLLLVRIVGVFDLKNPAARATVYWLHLACPLAAAWLYWLHRLAGPRIKWRVGLRFAAVVAVAIGADDGHSARAGSAALARRGAAGRGEVFLPVAGAHRHAANSSRPKR